MIAVVDNNIVMNNDQRITCPKLASFQRRRGVQSVAKRILKNR